MKKFSFQPIIFMIIITIIYTGTLATINEVTKDRILSNNEIKKQKALLYVLGVEVKDEEPSEIANLYDLHYKEAYKDSDIHYEGYIDNVLTALVFPIEGDALWGSLDGFIGLNPDLDEIVGLEFLSHNETPGLGGRIDEPWFKEQFRKVAISTEGSGTYVIYKPTTAGQVDSISGATATSKAVLKIVNDSIKVIHSSLEGGN